MRAFAQVHGFDALPDRLAARVVVGQDVATATVAIIEQGGEQRRRCLDATAALGLREHGVFVMQQLREQALGLHDGLFDTGAVAPQAQRQGVEEQAQHAVGAGRGVQATEQHGAEHHVVAATDLRQ